MCWMRSTYFPRCWVTFANHWNKATTKACSPFWKRRQKRSGTVMLWEIDIHLASGERDRTGELAAAAARELGLAGDLQVAAARGYLVEGESLSRADLERLANELLVDPVV